MRHLSRVVWSEGMYLGPHHFQAQNAYFENTIHFTTSALWPEAYGLLGYELDAEALRNGTASMVHGRGIFPDGMAFHMPEFDTPPSARSITDLFPPTRDHLMVLLAVPSHRPGAGNCALTPGDGGSSRFLAEERPLFDENTGQDQKPVMLGRKNIRLMVDTEPSEGLQTLPLARILRDSGGQYIYDEAFIPPCLRISACERLVLMTRRLIDILKDKSAAYAAAGRVQGGLSAGISPHQVASLWFLHAVNSALASLRHLCFSKHAHPEELYLELSRLAGALCTFGLESRPDALPLYNHLELTESFGALDQHIRAHLEMLAPTNCVTVPLEPAGRYLYEGPLTDDRCLGRSRWIFGIHSRIGEAQLISGTPQLVKICSAKFVPELVRRAVPGLTLTHVQTPPAAISPKVDAQYFVVSKSGPCWDHIVETKRVGVYVPGEIPNPELELLILLES